MIPLDWFLSVSAVMFALGVYGILTQKNAVRILISVEIMLNATNVSMIAFNGIFGLTEFEGWAFVLIIIAVAAVEAAVGLAILLSVFRNYGEIDVTNIISLKEPEEKELI